MKITAIERFVDGEFRPWTFVKVETSDAVSRSIAARR